MRTDRLNQLLVTACIFIVMVMQFNVNTSKRCNDCGDNCQCPACGCDTPSASSGPEDLNNPALNEPKYGLFSRLFQRRPQYVSQPQCVGGNCPQVMLQPNPSTPTANPDCPDGKCPLINTPSVARKLEQKKTGMVRCSCCSKTIVGGQLHTEWTSHNEPISPCCEDCWSRMDHAQREKSVENWARKAGLSEETVARYRGAIQ